MKYCYNLIILLLVALTNNSTLVVLKNNSIVSVSNNYIINIIKSLRQLALNEMMKSAASRPAGKKTTPQEPTPAIAVGTAGKSNKSTATSQPSTGFDGKPSSEVLTPAAQTGSDAGSSGSGRPVKPIRPEDLNSNNKPDRDCIFSKLTFEFEGNDCAICTLPNGLKCYCLGDILLTLATTVAVVAGAFVLASCGLALYLSLEALWKIHPYLSIAVFVFLTITTGVVLYFNGVFDDVCDDVSEKDGVGEDEKYGAKGGVSEDEEYGAKNGVSEDEEYGAKKYGAALKIQKAYRTIMAKRKAEMKNLEKASTIKHNTLTPKPKAKRHSKK